MNPFREDLVARSLAEPCTVVIFGATGDLTHRKLIPALYNLAVDGELPTGVKIIGFARREKSDEEFRSGLAEINRKVSRSGLDERVWIRKVSGDHQVGQQRSASARPPGLIKSSINQSVNQPISRIAARC